MILWVVSTDTVDLAFRKCTRNRDLDFIDYNNFADFIIELGRVNSLYCVTIILHYNLMLLFIEKMRYPRVFDLMLLVLSPMHPEKNFNPEISDTIWKTMRNCDFFEIMGNKLLFGQKVSDKNFKIQPKPADKTVLKYGSTETRNAAFEPVPILTEVDRELKTLLEEKAGLKFDIDGIMGLLDYLKNNSQAIIQESESAGSSNETVTNNPLGLNYNLYPSREKITMIDLPKSPQSPKKTLNNININQLPFSNNLTTGFGSRLSLLSPASYSRNENLRIKKQKYAKIIDKRLDHLIDYQRLATYYPFEKSCFDHSDVDLIAAEVDITDNDKISEFAIVDLVKQLVVQLMFFNKKDGSSIPKFLEDKSMNVNSLVTAMLDFGEGGIFKQLLFDYLAKMPAELDCREQPSLAAGIVVNRLVDISQQANGFVIVYNKVFNRLLIANVECICKYIVNFAVVNHRLRNAHLETLLTTFYLTAKTNYRDGYSVFDYIMASVWDCILDILLTSG